MIAVVDRLRFLMRNPIIGRFAPLAKDWEMWTRALSSYEREEEEKVRTSHRKRVYRPGLDLEEAAPGVISFRSWKSLVLDLRSVNKSIWVVELSLGVM